MIKYIYDHYTTVYSEGELVKKFKKRAKDCGMDAVFIERMGYSV